MKYQEKKEEKKSKYQAKQLPKSKFNFHYDERIVNYKTQIEEVPEKLKPKPNEKQYQKKVTLIENELEELKAERKKKKT